MDASICLRAETEVNPQVFCIKAFMPTLDEYACLAGWIGGLQGLTVRQLGQIVLTNLDNLACKQDILERPYPT